MNVFEHGDHPGSAETAIGRFCKDRNIIMTIMNLMNVARVLFLSSQRSGLVRLIPVLAEQGHFTISEEKMIEVQRASDEEPVTDVNHDERAYTDGPVTEVNYFHIEYGRFEDYIDWLNSTWKPTMEVLKKAGLIIDYKVFRATPKSPDQPNIFFMITYKNMAAYAGDNGDKSIELEAVAKKVIGSTEIQNRARVARGEYRKVLGSELIRELILK